MRHTGIDAPDTLTRDTGDLFGHWLSPELTLSQTCGMPYRTRLHGRVTLVGTPDHALDGCPPGHYRSAIVVRADDPRPNLSDFVGADFAYNDPISQSGWAALASERPDLLTGRFVRTGSHRASASAVRDGRADFAALDAVTWRLIIAEGNADGLRVVGYTQPTPGLPLIAAAQVEAEVAFACVAAAIDALAPADRETLGLAGLVPIPADDYLAVPIPPPPAAERHGSGRNPA
jgi:ABC-type phosphate/phosphonate transport system substrate-binding protein